LDSYYPDIAVDGNGIVYKVWQEFITETENFDIMIQTGNNLPVNISNSQNGSDYPHIVIGTNNQPYVTWTENS